MVVAFTGHRPDKLGGYDDKTNKMSVIIKEVDRVINSLPTKPTSIISGMALGLDMWVAMYAIMNNIPLQAYVPFVGQEDNWPLENRNLYSWILSKATDIKQVSAPGYTPWKMQKRNQAMVDNCDLLIAVWDGSFGGTHNCLMYASKQNRVTIRIDPNTLK